jgi:hypothetical protein
MSSPDQPGESSRKPGFFTRFRQGTRGQSGQDQPVLFPTPADQLQWHRRVMDHVQRPTPSGDIQQQTNYAQPSGRPTAAFMQPSTMQPPPSSHSSGVTRHGGGNFQWDPLPAPPERYTEQIEAFQYRRQNYMRRYDLSETILNPGERNYQAPAQTYPAPAQTSGNSNTAQPTAMQGYDPNAPVAPLTINKKYDPNAPVAPLTIRRRQPELSGQSQSPAQIYQTGQTHPTERRPLPEPPKQQRATAVTPHALPGLTQTSTTPQDLTRNQRREQKRAELEAQRQKEQGEQGNYKEDGRGR